MALSEGQHFTVYSFFRGYQCTFRAEIILKSELFKSENNSEQLQNNLENAQKTGFLSLKIVKMSLSKGQNLTYILILNLTYQPFELKI